MATTNIQITITTPANMTIAEAIRLYSESFGYQAKLTNPLTQVETNNPESRAEFCKRMIAEQVRDAIKNQQKHEAEKTFVPSDVQVS